MNKKEKSIMIISVVLGGAVGAIVGNPFGLILGAIIGFIACSFEIL
jgi:hypothetical protein